MQKIVCCFGEILLRFSPQLGGEWIKNATMPVFVGGAELNVATALANWNVPVQYTSVLPDNQLSVELKQYIEDKGISADKMPCFGDRIGTYYLPQGADLKNAGVIYDRAHSAFWTLAPGKVDWDSILENVSWFHFSAISPALNEDVVDACEEVLKIAKSKGITVSVDLNYRAKLWKYGKQPVEIMPRLAQYCDVIMGNIWAADWLLGIPVDASINPDSTQEEYLAHSIRTAEAIQKQYPQCSVVAHTFRFDAPPKGILYYTTLFTNGQQYVSPTFTIDEVVDKVGSGDCFMGGLIYGLYNEKSSQEVINYAAAAAFGKLNEYGDATKQSVEQVENLLAKFL
ncbi:sugar kinase [Flectobacillus longus]|uniref:sugar kinase n=1 Tax=Flectobacillus longus TaxID=2984207 RepID=UPI0024B79F35|nr:sugar kinase [Flectobacillus longus]MDI9877963.1 sugar kinase [Flectobacillus longus]